MPTPEPPHPAETTDASEPAPDQARGVDPWEKMPEDALNVPSRTHLDDSAEEPSADGATATAEDAERREGGATTEVAENGGAAEGDGTATDTENGAEASGRTPGWADFLPSPVFVLLLGLAGFAGWLSWTAVELDWVEEGTPVTPLIPPLLILLGWIVSVAVHEFAHALAAHLAGDRSLRGGGYLRFNPFTYRETFAGLVLPVLYLGLGAFGMTGPPTYVDWDRIRTPGRRVAVALAGPLASLLLAAVLAVTVSVLVPPGNDTTNWAIAAMAFLCFANLTAALVNLLPVPGLDGFEVLAAFLRGRWIGTARTNALFGSVAVFAVLWFPVVNQGFFGLLYTLLERILPNPAVSGMVFHGQLLLRFWG
ncbi:site-2 protease family protein [Nocardiopsis sp. NRRL B-16309]|uniref:site-2 protease family protein n=1 Tax=Nocardiopsis sp. NRRL B-16309 TaxID=1519494 RepID=UPI0006AEDAA8|nr:site-2 protease family protein [Nocardiopsis sp. NRRL B-16309]KOX20847.1 peptidase M50 [Nocardiopsis sp. NRRL B-16309]